MMWEWVAFAIMLLLLLPAFVIGAMILYGLASIAAQELRKSIQKRRDRWACGHFARLIRKGKLGL